MATSALNEINAKSVYVEPMGVNHVEVTLNDIDPSEILEQFGVEEIVEHIGSDSLLEQIGRDKAIEYFGIEEAE